MTSQTPRMLPGPVPPTAPVPAASMDHGKLDRSVLAGAEALVVLSGGGQGVAQPTSKSGEKTPR